jgi:large subunit ribosomal protein L4
VEVLPVTAIDPVSLARFDHVVVTVGAVRMLEEKLA